MSREQAIGSIKAGMELVEEELPKGMDILGTGDMGIGNTTSQAPSPPRSRVLMCPLSQGEERASAKRSKGER